MDSLGDRMKFYEKNNRPDIFPNGVPVIVRIDGKAFHSLTKQCVRPFDPRLHWCMRQTMWQVSASSGAKLAYTQSDEISLAYWVDDYHTQYYFGGKRDKFNSVLASIATEKFNSIFRKFNLNGIGIFDCRAFWVPNLDEVVNYFIWREQDAARNSVQMLARSIFSHKQCHKKNSKQLQEMCDEQGQPWHTLDQWKKNGTFFQKDHFFTLGRLTKEEDLEKFRGYLNVL